MKKKPFTIFCFIAVAFATVAGLLVFSKNAYAASPADWTDKTTINYDGKNYTDNKPTDKDHQFHKDGQDDNNKCVDVIRDFNNADITKATQAKLVTWRSFSPSFNVVGSAYCIEKNSTTIDIDATSLGNATKDPADAKKQATQNSCASKSGPLGWILCPVIMMLDGIFNWLDTQIQALLEINEDAYTNPLLYQAWSNIRNIAFLLLIPIMLVMVIGTALGLELFSAYTVKKALPRMVAAIIFITLSWYICLFLIGLFNVVGSGMIGLITSPFGLKGTITLADLFTPSFGGFVVQGGGIYLAIVALSAGQVVPILLLYLGGAVLVFFLAFLILTLRQMMVLMLVLAAPLAILAWIFPGNDKMWKLWWGTFSKLLIMFPLITSLIAMGRVFAYLVGNTPSGGLQGGLINPLLKITAYVMPYVLIPLTFKFAGGAFATLTGAVNDRGRGLFDRMKKSRAKRIEQIGKNAQGGKLMRLSKNPGRNDKINKWVARQTLQPAGGFAIGSERTARMNAADTVRKAAEAKELMESKVAEPIIKDDDKLWMVMNGKTKDEMRKIAIARAPGRFNEGDKKADLDQAVEEAWNFLKEGGRESAEIAATIANAGTGTGYNYKTDENGNFTYEDDMNMAIMKAAGGDASLRARMLAQMRPMAVQSGRPGLAGGGFANHLRTLDYLATSMDPDNKSNEVERIVVDSTNGEDVWEVQADGTKKKKTIKTKYTPVEALYDIQHDVVRSNAAAAIAGKRKDVQQIAAVIQDDAVGAMQTNGADGAKRAIRMLATVQGKHDSSAAVAPQNADVWADEVMTHEIDVDSLGDEFKKIIAPVLIDSNGQQKRTISIQDAMEGLHNDPQWNAMRNEFRRQGINAAQAQMATEANAAALKQAGIQQIQGQQLSGSGTPPVT